ncbi:hypothetical protein [Paraburkholderia fungorum]|uniref:Glycosyltransferase RgtA/B/C/D-like domain-containing protein n=1 Tax=Paraburkholderia fungorum TaxID=134537 RepID=A0AAW3V7G3_9BURK|nr:hypothetical protein [Paraburkholderia fungorum]MBB4517828.1 hypothetical protein [Paraburkholderia fungorum]MBB6205797.1 hypothetical protein [Paraburkholderia fungorum]
MALFIVVFGQTFSSVQLHETGDFAANSLLVLQAKHFGLLVGNYSRVGFNHPGPAFLYVLAAGEIAFFDLTRWVTSPFSGQIYAVALLSGFWIASIGLLLRRMQRSMSAAVTTTALFVGVTAYINYQAFAGTWFPHLYYFAFAAFTVSLAALIMGRRDGLLLLAVSLGFLLNGHASFFGIAAIMLACAVVANTWLYAWTDMTRGKWILSCDYLVGHFRAIGIAVAIGTLFLVPLAIQTILHFPGPVAEYAAFGRAHHANHLGDAIRFVGLFWNNGLFGILFGAAACAVLATNDPGRESADRIGSERAIVLSLASATVGFLFYSVFGVDNFSLIYVGIFYYAVPALALTLLLKRVFDNMTAVPFRVAGCVCVAVGVFTGVRIHQPPEYVSQYSDPEIPAVYAAIKRLGPDDLVFDLDGSANWEHLWATVAGTRVYALRQGATPFCIAQNWQLVFSQSARCTEAQISAARGRYLVSAMPKDGLVSAASVAGLYFYPQEAVK